MKRTSHHFILVTGLSGSGKTTVLKALEDLGFHCIDNLPLKLLAQSEVLQSLHHTYKKIAIGMDARDKLFLKKYPDLLATFRKKIPHFKILFLDAALNILQRRFSETRRPHPLGEHLNMAKAIEREQKILGNLKMLADYRLDTSELNIHTLRKSIRNLFKLTQEKAAFTVLFQSFGYKEGLPPDADLVFDLRFIKNPFFEKKLKSLTGLDPRVQKYVLKQKITQLFIKKILGFLGFLLKQYQLDQRTYLNVALGCTGGKHRSVTLAQELAAQFKKNGYRTIIHHRDID